MVEIKIDIYEYKDNLYWLLYKNELYIIKIEKNIDMCCFVRNVCFFYL